MILITQRKKKAESAKKIRRGGEQKGERGTIEHLSTIDTGATQRLMAGYGVGDAVRERGSAHAYLLDIPIAELGHAYFDAALLYM